MSVIILSCAAIVIGFWVIGIIILVGDTDGEE